jgi:hypothetical protein
MAVNKRSTSKIKKVMKSLKKASKAHAGQARTLSGVLSGIKKRSSKRNR